MARILIVEDEKHISRLIEVTLVNQGHVIEKAYDGVEGLEKVGSFEPELIVLDRMMPRMDGMEVMKTLQADPSRADIPVIFLTAKAQDDDVAEGWSRCQLLPHQAVQPEGVAPVRGQDPGRSGPERL